MGMANSVWQFANLAIAQFDSRKPSAVPDYKIRKLPVWKNFGEAIEFCLPDGLRGRAPFSGFA
jgi:hypothetical protein